MIVAFDLSLTATGYAGPDGCEVLSPPKGMKGLDRLGWIRSAVLDRAAGLVILEGLAFGARGRAMLDLAGLAAVIRLGLADAGIKHVDVPPSCLKKFATGKGNADKGAVLVAAVRRLGYEGSDHNAADARWLLEMARNRYGLEGATEMPAAHRQGLKGVDWPTLPPSLDGCMAEATR